MFDADRPIQNGEQDRLGRAVFGKYLARCILDHNNPESLVIGLYGGWGVGKTSIINLALAELRYASNNMFDNEKPIILNFSPWSYSGQNELFYSFFRRLSSEMRHSEFFESKKIIHLMELYIAFFTHKPITKASRVKHTWFEKMFETERTSQEKTFVGESGRDLSLVKTELNELLSNQRHKLIIFIDNISRLPALEVNQIFQIVKSIGDFSNTVYILALDKDYVIHAINQLYVMGGADFLEKVVQLPFEIPPIAKQDLEIILLDRLKQVMAIVPDDSWDTDYWADIYYSSLKYFFENVRDISRYINTLSFGYVHVKEVVNAVDFFAITAIEIFEPNVFYGIRDNKDLFIDLVDNVYVFDKEKWAEDKLRCDEILNRCQNIREELLVQLLIRLFPRLRKIYQTNVYFYHSDVVARQNRRICSYDVFEIYFRLTIPTGYISDIEMNAILALTHDEEGFALALLRLNQDDRILKFLDLLDSSAVHKIPTEDIPNVVNALVDSADLFTQTEGSQLSFNTPMRVHRILHQLIRRFADNKQRFEILRDAIKKTTNSLYIFVLELNEQSREHIENADTFIPNEERDFSVSQLASLEKFAVAKIKFWAEIGRLVEHPKLIPILYAWRDWGDEEECKRYVEHIVEDDRGLLAFLGAALKEPVADAMNKEEMNPSWRTYLKYIEDFISPDELVPHTKALFEDDYFVKLRENEQLTLLIFLNLVKPDTVKIFPDTAS